MNTLNRSAAVGILALLAFSLGWQLGSVPGLMGDEGSEGENVYELLSRDSVTVVGERSYIGPLIDYVRVPFIAWLGYTPLALRMPMWLAAIVAGWFLWLVLRKRFGDVPALFGAVGMLFSPIFLLTQRLGWAITLFPLFALLLAWLPGLRGTYIWLWWGLLAGVSLANHILFAPTLAGVLMGVGVYYFLQKRLYLFYSWRIVMSSGRQILIYAVLILVGFWAGFGMQFTVLQLLPEDQGDPSAVALQYRERWQLFTESAPLYFSGSSYVARYTGIEFSRQSQQIVSVILVGLIAVGVILLWRNAMWWALVAGWLVQLGALLVMIDRFTLRYFMMPTLGVWLMAGLGLGVLIDRIPRRSIAKQGAAIGLAVGLMVWMVIAVLVPFTKTGGSVNEFSLGGTRTNSADALVDHQPLVACLRGRGPVWSENVHIWNRLQYLSHQATDLVVVPANQKSLALLEVHYRKEGSPGGLTPGDFCPELNHFRVVQRQNTSR